MYLFTYLCIIFLIISRLLFIFIIYFILLIFLLSF